jgi:hypothetical protein
MMRRLRHRSRCIRALWVALLLFAVVFKPVLVLASEVHESEHLLQTGHSHASPGESHGIPADESPASGEVDPWHSLMHLGHCCSHPSAASEAHLPVTPGLAGGSPDTPLLPGRASVRIAQVLRPPIRA